MEQNQESILKMHLTHLVDELERKLAFPKNDWRRKEQLQAELADAQQRLASLSRLNRQFHRESKGLPLTQRSRIEASDAPSTTSRPRTRLLEVNYR